MTRTIGGTDRATAGGTALQIYARLLVLDSEGAWRDLTNLGPDNIDWLVRAEWGANIDDPVMTGRFTVIREQRIGGTLKSLSPLMSASVYNKNSANVYVPLVTAGRKIRLLTATVAPGVDPSTHWKRVFDGKIDATDPGGDDSTMVIRCRDRGAWLLLTQIETLRNYGLLAGVAVQTVMQAIINDNAVPGLPTIYTPVDPAWLLQPYTQANKISVMEAIRALSSQIGFDLRYQFTDDGDVDPVLVFGEPARAKTIPDWTFGPNEYLSIPRSELSDDDVRNAVTVAYTDSTLGQVIERTRTNLTSIAAFNRRWMRIGEASTSNIDTSTEADRLGDAVVSDLGFPKNDHSMQTVYAWFISLGDLVRYQANGIQYDEDQDLGVSSFQHVIEEGHGTTTVDGRATPMGAYKRWLSYADTGGGGGAAIALSSQKVSETDSTYTIRVDASIAGSPQLPVVALMWTGANPPVSKIAGADPNSWVASGSEWTFTKPNPGTGDSLVGFAAAATAPIAAVFLNVPIPEGTAFAGPTLDAPLVGPEADPTNIFSVSWTPHSAPVGAKYRLYWRLNGGSFWTMVDYTVIGTATTYDVDQTQHHQVISPDLPNNSTFDAYVEMYSSAGDFLVQSAITSQGWRQDIGGG